MGSEEHSGKNDYSSSNSELPLIERIRKSMAAIKSIKEPSECIDHPLLDDEHVRQLTNMSRIIYFRYANRPTDPLVGLLINGMVEYNYELIEAYQNLRNILSGDQSIDFAYIDYSVVEEYKTTILDYKLGFKVDFDIQTEDGNYLTLATYKLDEQKIKYITDQPGDSYQQYEKYFRQDLKELIVKWVTEAGLPLNEKPIDPFNDE